MEEVEEDEEEGHVFIPVFRPFVCLAVEKAAISVVMLEKQDQRGWPQTLWSNFITPNFAHTPKHRMFDAALLDAYTKFKKKVLQDD